MNILFDLRVVVVFLVMITVLVSAHEMGHYLFARLFGMGVEEFAIGLGRPLLGTYFRRRYRIPLSNEDADAWERGDLEIPLPEGIPKMLESSSDPGELVRDAAGPYLDEKTDFTVRAWPLGGFVRIRGMMPEAQGKETRVPGGFFSKPPWQRFVVLLAGPVFSVLAGLAILVPFLMVVGMPRMGHDPVLTVGPGGAAAKAGLRDGDRIVSIDGQAITDFFTVVKIVRDHSDKPLTFTVNRAGKELKLVAIPVRDKAPTKVVGPDLTLTDETAIQGKLDIGSSRVNVPLPFFDAAKEACLVPYLTIAGLIDGIRHPSELKDEVGGPIAIVQTTADATSEGMGSVVFTSAALSISLGIFNLLPLFPLDGGQMLVALAEMFRRGRRLSMRSQDLVAKVGLSAIFVLVVSVFYIDVTRTRGPGSAPPTSTATKK